MTSEITQLSERRSRAHDLPKMDGVKAEFSETSGSHNALIVWCEIPFHRVMKLNVARASFSLPPCYLGVMGANDAFANGERRCLLRAFSWPIYFSLTHLSPIDP